MLFGKGNAPHRGNFVWQIIFFRIVYFYYFECFQLVLKSIGNARLSQILFGIRMGGGPAGAGARLVKRKYFIGFFFLTVSNENAFD